MVYFKYLLNCNYLGNCYQTLMKWSLYGLISKLMFSIPACQPRWLPIQTKDPMGKFVEMFVFQNYVLHLCLPTKLAPTRYSSKDDYKNFFIFIALQRPLGWKFGKLVLFSYFFLYIVHLHFYTTAKIWGCIMVWCCCRLRRL